MGSAVPKFCEDVQGDVVVVTDPHFPRWVKEGHKVGVFDGACCVALGGAVQGERDDLFVRNVDNQMCVPTRRRRHVGGIMSARSTWLWFRWFRGGRGPVGDIGSKQVPRLPVHEKER